VVSAQPLPPRREGAKNREGLSWERTHPACLEVKYEEHAGSARFQGNNDPMTNEK